jgi:multisubunit Na+/H+ antiporter MnhC subunit
VFSRAGRAWRSGEAAAGRASRVPLADPVVQALTLIDVVVGATLTALLVAMVIQIEKRHRTVDPDHLSELRG